MDKRKFIRIAGAAVCIAGGGGYLLSDKNNFARSDINEAVSR